MVKRYVILRKKPTLTTEEFRHYWRNVHGPLIAQIPGLLKYVQYHVRSELDDDTEQPVDGLAELWFESEEAQKIAYQTPQYAAVEADEPNLFEMNDQFIHPVMVEVVVEVI